MEKEETFNTQYISIISFNIVLDNIIKSILSILVKKPYILICFKLKRLLIACNKIAIIAIPIENTTIKSINFII